MESIGMPYGHIVIVLQALDLNELPKSLRLDRWSKEAREEIRCIFVGACFSKRHVPSATNPKPIKQNFHYETILEEVVM
ncbi:hypothetical protein JHK87_024811 [Glycine soja]|nr:hypothetical protein JHK87_024811 [Glycine soja]